MGRFPAAAQVDAATKPIRVLQVLVGYVGGEKPQQGVGHVVR